MMILKLQHLFERDHEVTSLAFPARRDVDPSRTWLRSRASRSDSVRNRVSVCLVGQFSGLAFGTTCQSPTGGHPEALQLQPCDWRDRCDTRSTQSSSET